MGSLDRQVRKEAVTQRAQIFGHNYQDQTEYDLRLGAAYGYGGHSDLCGILGVNPTTGAYGDPDGLSPVLIRVLQPHYGELVECYIDFFMCHYPFDSFGTPGKNGAGSNDLKFFIGDFTNNDFNTPRTSYSLDEIAASHKLLTGLSSGYTVSGGGDARTIVRKLNLLPQLYKHGDAKYVEDGFLLGLCFNSNFGYDVSQGGSDRFRLEQLRIVQSITGIK